MHIYSRQIIRFIHEIKASVKTILAKEIGRKVFGDRFYDERQGISYPIKVVVYNNKSMLGYFSPDFYELGFHERLMHAKQEVQNVIRHELAHYLTWIKYGVTIQAHGPEFRAFCLSLGWGEEVYRATSCLEGELEERASEESSILRKVKKLMALASSANQNEAELAMIKSRELLLKHNIESPNFCDEKDEPVFLKRILRQKKEDAKMRAIARILETFFVSAVYNRAGDFTYLEILGNAVNIEIAEYVAAVLQEEMEQLWCEAASTMHLRGLVAKNSFFLGLARGYCAKIDGLKNAYGGGEKQALMVLEKQLVEAKAWAYKSLSSSKSRGSHSSSASRLGEQMGKTLTINPAVTASSTHGQRQLSYLQ